MTRSAAAPKSIRLCHLADVHLGYRRYARLTKAGFNQREVDVNQAFHEAVGRIVKLKPNVTLIAGDLFHSVRPSNAVYAFCFRELKLLAEATMAPVIILSGNHESPKRSDSGSPLALFAEIPGVSVADSKPEKFAFPEISLSVQCVPHESLMNISEHVVRADDTYRFNVLLLHGQFGSDWISDFGGAEIKAKSISVHEWDYIALGHIHLPRSVGMNGAYSGSLEHTACNIWAEAGENKGFWEIELPTRKKVFHTLTSPRQVVTLLPIDSLGKTPQEISLLIRERISSVPGGVDGKIVRLELRNTPRELLSALNHKEIRQFRSRALNLTLDVRPPIPLTQPNSANVQVRRGLKSELELFVGSWKSSVAKREDLVQLVDEYFHKMEEQDEARKA